MKPGTSKTNFFPLLAGVSSALAATVICVSLSSTAFAHEGERNADHTEKMRPHDLFNSHRHIRQIRMNRLSDRLDLSEEQRESAKEIMRDHRSQMRELHLSAAEELEPERSEIKAQTRERMTNILTAEQLVEFDELRRAREERRQERINQLMKEELE